MDDLAASNSFKAEVPPRRRMRVEISQHEKRLRKLLKEFNWRIFRNWGIEGRHRKQTVRFFSKLIVPAATCRSVFRAISDKTRSVSN
ncbi:hypothetical protein PoB_007415700 [Plakobranchus ocellatus]|uniref:Uncharacterized protein n=1 Tax=Plakobranchus ocellatus TaxID=259542 RepID=A0AAV4DTG0_9GAST|nr:hypothetical protein PoB_007415700 [Plakobranchus ocellatus]